MAHSILVAACVLIFTTSSVFAQNITASQGPIVDTDGGDYVIFPGVTVSGSPVNSGVLELRDADYSVDNRGTVSLNAGVNNSFGIHVADGRGTITSSGRIDGANGTAAVYLEDGGSVVNSGTVVSLTAAGIVVAGDLGTATVENSGALQIGGASAITIANSQDGALASNSGSVQLGNGTAMTLSSITGSDADARLIQGGTVTQTAGAPLTITSSNLTDGQILLLNSGTVLTGDTGGSAGLNISGSQASGIVGENGTDGDITLSNTGTFTMGSGGTGIALGGVTATNGNVLLSNAGRFTMTTASSGIGVAGVQASDAGASDQAGNITVVNGGTFVMQTGTNGINFAGSATNGMIRVANTGSFSMGNATGAAISVSGASATDTDGAGNDGEIRVSNDGTFTMGSAANGLSVGGVSASNGIVEVANRGTFTMTQATSSGIILGGVIASDQSSQGADGNVSLLNTGVFTMLDAGQSGISVGGSSAQDGAFLISNSGRFTMGDAAGSGIQASGSSATDADGQGDDGNFTILNGGTFTMGNAATAGISLGGVSAGNGELRVVNSGTFTMGNAGVAGLSFGGTSASDGDGQGTDGNITVENRGTFQMGDAGQFGVTFGGVNAGNGEFLFSNSGTFTMGNASSGISLGGTSADDADGQGTDGNLSVINGGTFVMGNATQSGVSFGGVTANNGELLFSNTGRFTMGDAGNQGFSFAGTSASDADGIGTDGNVTVQNLGTIAMGNSANSGFNLSGVTATNGEFRWTNSGTFTMGNAGASGAGLSLSGVAASDDDGIGDDGNITVENSGSFTMGTGLGGISMNGLTASNGELRATNSGTFTMGDAGNTGMLLSGSSAMGDLTLVNSGRFTMGTASSGLTVSGVSSAGGAVALVNSGTFTMGDSTNRGMFLAGVSASGNISLTNSGSFTMGNGLVGISFSGLSSTNGDVSLVNSGTFSMGNADPNSGGISINGVTPGSGQIRIENSGAFTMGSGRGVNIGGNTGNVAFTNSGSFRVGGAGPGLLSGGGAPLTFTNSGRFETTDGEAILINGGRDLIVVNSGILTAGNGQLALSTNGNASVTLQSGSVVTGGMTVGNGNTDVLNLQGAGSYAFDTGGFETLNKSGTGTWSLGGTHALAMGSVANVDAGRLDVNGAFTGADFLVDAGATLGGIGTITGNVVNDGFVSPGTSPGTMTINGNFTNNAGATVVAELQSPSVFDQIVVQGGQGAGQANLAGTLQVVPVGLIQSGDTFDVITTQNGIVGDFGQITDSSLVVSLGSQIVNTGGLAQNYRLTASRSSFTTLGLNENQASIARALDAGVPTATGAFANMILGLETLPDATAFRSAIDQLSPQSMDGVNQTMFSWNNTAMNQMERYFQSLRTPPASGGEEEEEQAAAVGKTARAVAPVFAAMDRPDGKHGFLDASRDDAVTVFGFFNEGELSARPGRSGSTFDTDGMLLAYTSQESEHWRIGGAIGVGETDAVVGGGLNASQVEHFQAGPVASYQKDDSFVDVAVTYATHDFRNVRTVAFPGFLERETSTPEGDSISAYVGGGGLVKDPTRWHIQPTYSLQFTHFSMDAFQETGGAAALAFAEQEEDSLRSQLGFRVSRQIEGKKRTFIPEVRARWAHEFLNDERLISARFAQSGAQVFSTFQGDPSEDNFIVGASLTATIGDHSSIFGSYDLDLGDEDDEVDSARVGFSTRW